MSKFFDLHSADPEALSAAVAEATTAIRDERLVVLPTDTVYGVAADAFSAEAVQALLAAKGRGREKPPPVLLPDVRTVDGVADDISDDARALLSSFWPGKLTVVLWAQPTLRWDLGDTQGTVAVRVPDHPVARDVLRATGPLAVSSANTSGDPAATTGAAAQSMLADAVAVYLEAGPCHDDVPSTIVDCTREHPEVLRLGAIGVDELQDVVPGVMHTA